jgi:hypothetical protein
MNILLFELHGDLIGYVKYSSLNVNVYLYLQGDKGYCYIPYQYLIDKRFVSTSDSFWAIAGIIPRGMRKGGYIGYPNFTLYHQRHMFPLTALDIEKEYYDCD